MRLLGPVNAVHILCGQEVTHILHNVRGCVDVVVATFSVMAKAVCVLHSQV